MGGGGLRQRFSKRCVWILHVYMGWRGKMTGGKSAEMRWKDGAEECLGPKVTKGRGKTKGETVLREEKSVYQGRLYSIFFFKGWIILRVFVDNSFLDTLIGNRLEECSFMKFGWEICSRDLSSSSFECFKDKGWDVLTRRSVHDGVHGNALARRPLNFGMRITSGAPPIYR